MSRSAHTESSRKQATPDLRFSNTLAFRVALVVNLAVVGVLGVFAIIDYQRSRSTHLREETERLREEGRVLRVAKAHSARRDVFQRFVDDFCRQMSSAASPGHHIAVLDRDGKVTLRAHERRDPGLEAKMSAIAGTTSNTFRYKGADYLSVGVHASDGSTIAVAQSLAAVERIISTQRTSRLVSLAVLVVLISGVSTIALLAWVRYPLRSLVAGVAAVGRGRFGVRVRASGSAELQFLAERINDMARSLGRVEARRRAEMKKAQGIQRGLLPRGDHDIKGFDVATIFLPTDSVGGDLYDVVDLADGSTLLAIMDVSGHGVPAALYTALLRTVLRYQAAVTSDIRQIAEAMNHELSGITDQGEFATCFYVRLLCDSNEVEYVSAGHDPAIVVRSDGRVETLVGSGLPLGVEDGTKYERHRMRLEHDDRLFLYTDGLHEVFDEHRRQLGRNGLESLVVETRSLLPNEQVRSVVEKVRSFQRGMRFEDDVTLLCARRM